MCKTKFFIANSFNNQRNIAMTTGISNLNAANPAKLNAPASAVTTQASASTKPIPKSMLAAANNVSAAIDGKSVLGSTAQKNAAVAKADVTTAATPSSGSASARSSTNDASAVLNNVIQIAANSGKVEEKISKSATGNS
jgi:hypothetical protein